MKETLMPEIQPVSAIQVATRIRYAVEQRLRFIDFLLAHYGWISREALEDHYGISAQQASTDFQHYLSMAENNMAYRPTTKRYERTTVFRTVWE